MKSLLLPLLLLFAAAPAAEARMPITLADTVRSGFNALDHVLQRPLGSPRFDHKRFGDHLFLSGGAGVSMNSGGDHRPGWNVEFSIGDWFTPVHGWRLSAEGGLHSLRKGMPRAYYGGASLDYLLNFSSLLRGYDPSRRFELIGAIGVGYQRVRQHGAWGHETSARASLQARFNVCPSLYLYVEPRLELMSGTQIGMGNGNGFRRFYPDASLHLGLGYRLLRGAERQAGTTPFVNVDDSHLFFGAGGGVSTFTRNITKDDLGPSAMAYVGKWLSPTAGLRLKAQVGRFEIPGSSKRRYIGSGSLDYVWNIASAMGGYRPDEVFGLNLNLGVAMAYANKTRKKYYPGLEAGLTASFRLSRNWSIYVEPQVQVFTRRFGREAAGARGNSPVASVMAGLHYTIGNFYHDFPQSYEDYLGSKHYFLTLSGGAGRRFRGHYGTGGMLTAGFGKRFTPVSSWRVTAEGEVYRRSPGYVSLAVAADYICSISTAMAGYNDDRVFDLSGVIGVAGGAVNYADPVKPFMAGKVGLLGAFRLSDALSLNVEPQLLAVTTSGHRNTGVTPEFRVMVGLSYRLGRQSGFAPGAVDDSPLEGRRNFVSLTGGPTFNSSTLLEPGRKVNGAFDASVGRWFTLVSGARLGVTYDFMPRDGRRDPFNMGTIHVDYMLNMTSLITRDADRRFHIIGIVGGGVAFSGADRAKAGAMGEAGLQFRYNLPAGIDVHLEPMAGLWMHRAMPTFRAHGGLVAIGRIMAGVSYRF